MTELLAILKGERQPLAVIIDERDIAITAMTADTVFLFQEVGKLLNCRVIGLTFALFIESALQVHQ